MDERSAATKVCPDCAETIKAEARRCRFCGYRFDGAPGPVTAGHPVSGVTAVAVPTAFGKRSAFLVWALLSALLMAVGSFGPWITAFGSSIAGTDGSNDGWLVVGAVVFGAVLLLLTRKHRAAGLWPLIGGIAGAAITIYDRHHASHVLGQQSALVREIVQIGWGLNLAMIASISFAVCGLVWLFAIETSPEITAASTAWPWLS